LYIFSDESGDNGVRINNKKYKGGTSAHKIVTMIHFVNEKHAFNFLERANDASLDVFSHDIKKWKKLQGKNKCDQVISSFLNQAFRPEDILISFCVIDKKYFSKHEDIKNQTILAYQYLFKRSVNFWKWIYYQKGLYRNGPPRINWLVDYNNEKNFIEPLTKRITEYIKSADVIFDKPGFIHKKAEKQPQYSYKRLIRLADLIGGVLLNHFAYLNFSESYEIIANHSKGIRLKENNTEWVWDGALSIPYYNDAKKIIGKPSYVKK